MLTGYKTFICCALGVVVVAASALGYIGQTETTLLLSLLGFGTAAGLRNAINGIK